MVAVGFHSKNATRAGRRAEAGETLVETLITIMVMGLVVVGLLVGLVTVARMVDQNNRVTHAGNTAQSYAEQLKQPVNDGLTNMEYRPCGEPDPGVYPAFDGNMPGAAYQVVVSDVQFATAVPSGGSGEVTWSSTCPTADLGLQMLTVQVTVSGGPTPITETLPMVKRDARCEYYVGFDNPDQGPC